MPVLALQRNTVTDSVSITQRGLPAQSVTTERSPCRGGRWPDRRQPSTLPLVARFLPESTRPSSSFALSSLTEKLKTS